MKVLGIDSSGNVASVAIVDDDILVAEFTVNNKKTHSVTLLPMLDEVVKMAEVKLEDIDAIAVAKGPGSFTGLRIGAATVKGLGLALDKPVVAISTLEALAYNVWGSDKLICPIMDARRNQVYTAGYIVENEIVEVIEPTAIDIKELIDQINNLGKTVVFVGDGISVYKEQIEELIAVSYSFAPAHMNRQKASAIATMGAMYYKAGKYENASDFTVEYLRKSQAEREREERA